MGKVVGLSGTIRGKIGTIVYTKGEKGVSYARSYQPQVYNPKTTLQTEQRAKMNLVGRLSAVTPKALLSGMDGENNRQRRSNFNARLLNAVRTEGSGVDIIAKLQPSEVNFSYGSEAIQAKFSNMSVTATAVTAQLTLDNAAMAGRYGERVVVAIIDPFEKSGYSVLRWYDQMLDSVDPVNISIPLGYEMADESLVCVYRIPFALSDTGVNYRTQTLENNGEDIIAKMLESRGELVRGYGNTLLQAKQVFTRG